MFVVVIILLVAAGLSIPMPVEFVAAPVPELVLFVSAPEGAMALAAGGGCCAGVLVD